MERKRLAAPLQFRGVIEGWTVNTINKQIWRFIPKYDRDDLVQEAHLAYWITVRRYARDKSGNLIDDRHFMALYKRIYTNRLNRMAMGASLNEIAISQMSNNPDASLASLTELLGGSGPDMQIELAAAVALNKPLRNLLDKLRENGLDSFVYNHNGHRQTTLAAMAKTVGVSEKGLRCMIRDHLGI